MSALYFCRIDHLGVCVYGMHVLAMDATDARSKIGENYLASHSPDSIAQLHRMGCYALADATAQAPALDQCTVHVTKSRAKDKARHVIT